MNKIEGSFNQAPAQQPPAEQKASVIDMADKKEKKEALIKTAIELREKMYNQDVAQNPEQEATREALNTHNKIVQEYAESLIKALRKKGELSPKKAKIALIATILHDSGKLNSKLLEHHEAGQQRAETIVKEMQASGIDIDPQSAEAISNAVLRHMNHPFLVAAKGERFPEPETLPDKIVFDADMLANLGFKNIAFRLVNQGYQAEDQTNAQKQDIPPIQATFNNVVGGLIPVIESMYTQEARTVAQEKLETIQDIYKKLDFPQIQAEINAQGGDVSKIKNLLNQKIKEAAGEADVESFLM